jgi:hypothetical protein
VLVALVALAGLVGLARPKRGVPVAERILLPDLPRQFSPHHPSLSLLPACPFLCWMAMLTHLHFLWKTKVHVLRLGKNWYEMVHMDGHRYYHVALHGMRVSIGWMVCFALS